jgi:UPF0271 protein
MIDRIDLNSDIGEGFGPWRMGDDAAILSVVTSANIACGLHAGDPQVMTHTMRLALDRGVGLGAHPGFADLQGFGRRRLKLSAEEVASLTAYQIGAAQGVAALCGGRLRHLKVHGALANMASEDVELARTIYRAALKLQPDLVMVVLAQTAQEQAARDLGCAWAGEIFADRAYNDDATLVDRSLPGAVLHEPEAAAERILEMLRAGAIVAASGRRIPCRIDTVCLHGDTPEAVAMATTLKARLQEAGIRLQGL